jgi:outer membrane immunogenic protein
MRKYALALVAAFCAAPALAAEPYAPPVYDWSGFYVGVHAGYGWADTDFDYEADANPGVIVPFEWESDGALGGGQIGYNFQTGGFVFGVEVDVSAMDMSETVDFDALFGVGSDTVIESSFGWLATIRGRVGYAFDNFLIYGTGGYVTGEGESEGTSTSGGVTTTFSEDSDFDGWTAGGGVEVGFTENLSLKAEYLYIELDDETQRDRTDTATITTGSEAHMARIGLNYRF